MLDTPDTYDDQPEIQVHDIDDCIFDPGRGHIEERTSTPFDHSITSVSAVSSTDPFTQQKISALEDELAALRSQIAQMISEQEKSRIQPSKYCKLLTIHEQSIFLTA